MKPQALNEEERAIINDEADAIILSVIKGMSIEEMRSFLIYKVKDMQHYTAIQLSWLHTELYLLRNRLGHPEYVPDEELMADMKDNKVPEKFRVFYVLRYPQNIEIIAEVDDIISTYHEER